MFSFGIAREGTLKGHYMDYEIGSMDGAYKGRLHVALGHREEHMEGIRYGVA